MPMNSSSLEYTLGYMLAPITGLEYGKNWLTCLWIWDVAFKNVITEEVKKASKIWIALKKLNAEKIR